MFLGGDCFSKYWYQEQRRVLAINFPPICRRFSTDGCFRFVFIPTYPSLSRVSLSRGSLLQSLMGIHHLSPGLTGCSNWSFRMVPRRTGIIPSASVYSCSFFRFNAQLSKGVRSFLLRPLSEVFVITRDLSVSPGELPDCPSLRASSDHRFIVGALRARRMVWRLPLPFSSCAFCEHERAPGRSLLI